MKSLKVVSEQLILCNVVFANKHNVVGIRNTLAIKEYKNETAGYDLITKDYIPFRNKNSNGICMDIISIPFKGKKDLVNLEELDLYLQKYREKLKNENDFYESNEKCFNEIRSKCFKLKKK